MKAGRKMEYTIRKINTKNDIEKCDLFEINNYQWKNVQTPKAYGYAGYLEGKGIYVQFICEEENPKRAYTKDRDRVCEDSAVEVFMAFPEKDEELSNNVMYINFEMNANGVMYSKFGKGRKGREFISEEICKKSNCHVDMEENKWVLTVTIPEEFLQEVCDWNGILKGEPFYCNFYKISESPEIEHYGSFSRIESETPNFHLPIYFAKATIK